MKTFRIDFKLYRNYDCLTRAMQAYCQLKRGRKTRHKGICPRPECSMKHKRTLILYAGNAVAFCYACNRSIDALDIVHCSEGFDYLRSAEELEILCASALQCHT